MSDEQGALIATLISPDDRKAMHFIGVEQLERYQALETAVRRLIAGQVMSLEAYQELEKLMGRDG
jgi:hypothetical protein